MSSPGPNDTSISSSQANPQQKNPFMFSNAEDPEKDSNISRGFKRGGKIKKVAKSKSKVATKKVAGKVAKKTKPKVKAKGRAR